MSDKYNKVQDFIKNELSGDAIVWLWFEYCMKNSDYENTLYPMSMLDDETSGQTATEILENLNDFRITDNFFYWTIWGLSSCEYWDDEHSPIELSELAEYVADNDDDLNNKDLRNFLNDLEG